MKLSNEAEHSRDLSLQLGLGAIGVSFLIPLFLGFVGCKFSDLELHIKEAAVTGVTDYPSTNTVEKVGPIGGSSPP